MLTDILSYILYIYIYISVYQYSTDARRAQASGFNDHCWVIPPKTNPIRAVNRMKKVRKCNVRETREGVDGQDCASLLKIFFNPSDGRLLTPPMVGNTTFLELSSSDRAVHDQVCRAAT
jgi:hypothetical protein